MTTVKNALTILKSKCFVSKIEVNIKYIGSRNRALYASAAQESVYVHVGVSVCSGSLFAFVCLFVLYECLLFRSLFCCRLSQWLWTVFHNAFTYLDTLFQHKNTQGPSAQPTDRKMRSGYFSGLYNPLLLYTHYLYMHFQRNVLCLLLFLYLSQG